jgi:succinate dehydrogenase / fumarate reductase cytochrome b subunit
MRHNGHELQRIGSQPTMTTLFPDHNGCCDQGAWSPSRRDAPALVIIPSAWIRSGAALTGLLLVLFVLVHLIGLLPAVLAPEQFEAYATALHSSPWLPLVEFGLLLLAVIHIGLTLSKAIANHRAGNTATLRSRRQSPLASLASRSATAAGLVTLGFLILHLQQLRWPRPAAGEEAATLIQVLQQPWNAVLYAAAALALALHLLHGAEAAHRSLGWLTPHNSGALRTGGGLMAALVGGGFLTVTLVLALGGVA